MIGSITAHSIGQQLFLAGAEPGAKAAETLETPATPAEEAARSILLGVVDLGVVAISLAFLLCFGRLLTGPTLVDRGLAGDTISLQVVGLAILLTIQLDSLVYFDAVLIIAILGFASTVAFAQFISRRRAV